MSRNDALPTGNQSFMAFSEVVTVFQDPPWYNLSTLNMRSKGGKLSNTVTLMIVWQSSVINLVPPGGDGDI